MRVLNKFERYLLGYVRRVSRWIPQRYEALKRAEIVRGKQWACEQCFASTIKKEVDHINPIIPLTGFDDWNGVISRALYVEADGLQVLCKSCHQKKTKAENKIRKEFREKGKKKKKCKVA